MGTFDAQAQGLGGWTLSAHHEYNPATGVLYSGDGSRREAEAMGQTVRPHYSGNTDDIAVAKDGSFYTVYAASHAVWHYAPKGTLIATVAGTVSAGYSGEGLVATASRLNNPCAIAVGPDGLVYIADRQNHRIRRVEADGRLRTIAGTGANASTGDGGPALQAGISLPEQLAFLPDGSLLFTEGARATVRRIGPDGVVRRFAGTGSPGETGVGGPRPTGSSSVSSAGPRRARRAPRRRSSSWGPWATSPSPRAANSGSPPATRSAW